MLNWLFKKKEVHKVNLAHIGVDIHSHIIPGIDDGVQTIEEALAMLEKMSSIGYSRVITTPHIIWDCYKNTPEIINKGLHEVRMAAEHEGLPIRIDAAAEYFIDEHFMELLQSDSEILTLPGNRVLVELPYSTPLLNVSETLFYIIEKGFQPVLAHPERYTYYYSDPSVYRKLVNQGCELQVNLLSLSGYYGETIADMANWLLQNGLITFLGSDAHKIQHLDMIQRLNNNEWLSSYPFQNEKLQML
ncbi:tyrosine-protein phosphatase [Dyadobacter alkalitolerans]|uniref:tyrosine-protein phosphatase n=1 Tax=Dyadobacter alkalitolerans TaxID=492736 RepID=UPI00040E66F4|nr:CpsB/CapC family capsule biosynthesis tyrosine phosphatase [Dyadobacter alkalitolerans]